MELKNVLQKLRKKSYYRLSSDSDGFLLEIWKKRNSVFNFPCYRLQTDDIDHLVKTIEDLCKK